MLREIDLGLHSWKSADPCSSTSSAYYFVLSHSIRPSILSVEVTSFISTGQITTQPQGTCRQTAFQRAPTQLWEVLQVALVVKNPPANAGDVRDAGSIPGSGRSPGGGHGNPLQYSYLENPMDRGAWWVTVHRVTKSRKGLKWLSTHARDRPESSRKSVQNTRLNFTLEI